MSKLKLYTSSHCATCHMVKTVIEKHKFEFEELPIEVPENLEALKKLGVQSVPVVVNDDKVLKTVVEILADLAREENQ